MEDDGRWTMDECGICNARASGHEVSFHAVDQTPETTTDTQPVNPL